MKLLERQVIVKEKVDEQRLTIDEGLKLARRIDTLRETSASESSRLAKFRDESLKKVKEEIDELIAQKTDLVAQISNLTQERLLLQIPLDKEWKEVKEAKKQVKGWQDDLLEREVELNQRESGLGRVKTALSEAESRIEALHISASQNALKSQELKQESEIILAHTKAEESKAQRYFEVRNEELLAREAEVAVKEREVEIVRGQNVKSHQELTIKERQLVDRYQTLERTLTRLKNKNGRRI